MVNYSIYIITCDKSNWILNLTIPLMEKYWNIEKNVKILGFSKPTINLPNWCEFIQMKEKQESIDDWSNDIYDVMKNDENEYLIFMLDDFLPLDYINKDMLDFYFNKMNNDKDIVRCGLGSDMQFLPHTIIEKYDTFSLIELNQNSNYRLSTQPSIWRKEYLLNYLKQTKNPWHFETAIKPLDGKKIISTIGDYCHYYLCESALSSRYPNKVNILGMKFEDLEFFINSGLLKEDSLQFGMHRGNVPEFNKYKYTFKLDTLKNYVNENKYKEYCIRYYKTY